MYCLICTISCLKTTKYRRTAMLRNSSSRIILKLQQRNVASTLYTTCFMSALQSFHSKQRILSWPINIGVERSFFQSLTTWKSKCKKMLYIFTKNMYFKKNIKRNTLKILATTSYRSQDCLKVCTQLALETINYLLWRWLILLSSFTISKSLNTF